MPGTAGLGQPGNSVLVARRAAYGGPFASRPAAPGGQGPRHDDAGPVGVHDRIGEAADDRAAREHDRRVDGGRGIVGQVVVPAVDDREEADSSATTLDTLYGPSKGDQLTFVTSASGAPWNRSDATVVVAKLEGQPFAPTQQGGRTDADTGTSGDSSAWPSVILTGLLYLGAVVGSVVLYRRMRPRIAYVLTIGPLVALTVLVGQNLSRLLPAWM